MDDVKEKGEGEREERENVPFECLNPPSMHNVG